MSVLNPAVGEVIDDSRFEGHIGEDAAEALKWVLAKGDFPLDGQTQITLAVLHILKNRTNGTTENDVIKAFNNASADYWKDVPKEWRGDVEAPEGLGLINVSIYKTIYYKFGLIFSLDPVPVAQ